MILSIASLESVRPAVNFRQTCGSCAAKRPASHRCRNMSGWAAKLSGREVGPFPTRLLEDGPFCEMRASEIDPFEMRPKRSARFILCCYGKSRYGSAHVDRISASRGENFRSMVIEPER
jgi:hypothetical protein